MAEGGAVAGDGTRQRLLDEAERLFAERGYEGTSLRALAAVAGANIAAVNYHFRSKEGLLQAVVARAMEPVNIERDRRLRALQEHGGTPSVEQVVRAFVEPGVDLTSHHGARAPTVARFLGRVLVDPSPRIRQLFADQVDPVEGRYLDALREAAPHEDADTVAFGYTSLVGMLALHQAAPFAAIRWRGTPPKPATGDRERLVAFLTAGLTHILNLDRERGDGPADRRADQR